MSNNEIRRNITVLIVFVVCGFSSSYIFYFSGDQWFIAGLSPGLIFILGVTVLFSILNYRFPLVKYLQYYLALYVTYLLVYILTAITTHGGMFVGVVTGGVGALATFWWTKRLLINFSYKRLQVFLAGALAFTIIVFLFVFEIVFDSSFLGLRFSGDINTVFVSTFFIWQVVVGYYLFQKVQSSS